MYKCRDFLTYYKKYVKERALQMKKLRLIALLLAVVVTVTACRKKDTPLDNNPPPEDNNPPTASAPEYYVEIHGYKLDLELADEIRDRNDDRLTAREALDSGEYFTFEFKNLALARYSAGVSYNTAENPDFYDFEAEELNIEFPTPGEVLKVVRSFK